MLPRTLQGKLIFFFVSLIFITNAFLAIAAFSRERLAISNDTMEAAMSIGKILQKPAELFLRNGDKSIIDHIYANRSGNSAELLLTVYDHNWWKVWGDEARIPPGGFPELAAMDMVESHTGNGLTYRELFIPLIVDGKAMGAVGVGVTPVWQNKNSNTASDFASLMLLSMFVGIMVAIFASRSILEPLGDLMRGIDEFGRGDYSVRVGAAGTGELKELGDSFNRMALTVQETFKENLQRNRAIDEKLQELWEIYELMRKVTLDNEFTVILEKFLEKAQTLSFSSFAQIVLQNRRTLRFEEVVNVVSRKSPRQDAIEAIVNSCFISKTLHENLVDGISIIGVPLLSGSRMNGVIILAKNDSGGYSEGVRRFLETIAPVLASIIENASLYEALSDWNQQMKNILASINQGLATLDRNRKFLIVNERFLGMFGMKGFDTGLYGFREFCDQIPDRKFAEAMHDETAAFFEGIFSAAINDGAVQRVIEYNAGGRRQFAISLLPLRAGNEIRGAVLVVDDVTDQKKFEQQMIEAEKWAVLGRLAASVAHEIRNPLVAIRSLVEIIGEEVQGDLKEHANVVLGEVLRLNRVVAELLSLVKPEAANLKTCSLVEIVNELTLLIKHEAVKNEISLQRYFPECDCLVRIDAEKIKQAVLNLALNAFQAVGRCGKVEIRVERLQGWIVIKVINDGPQIEKSLQQRIFEPFFTTKANGTGLGLAITRKIVELHRGKIEFDSGQEMTEFRIFLPDGAENGAD
ncbi:MAG TPA: ATP-binding protein [Candidatus Ozemobacteraceae bacterium]|mgnify:CR=1 FL=1|nr:ATP-binding protein [Candidatus Ozemobacteraceae bacterium]